MRFKLSVFLLFLINIVSVSARAGTIWSTVEELSSDENIFRVQYHADGIELRKDQEIVVEFSAVIFRSLFNPFAPVGLDILLIQPNNPLGAPGRLSLLALVDFPSIQDGFRLDVRAVGDLSQLGTDPDSPDLQTFAVNQLDAQGVIVSTLQNGAISAAVPEPATAQTTAGVVLIASVFLFCRRYLQRNKLAE
jgi:hypothetical protein